MTTARPTFAGLLYDSGYGWPVATFVDGDAVVPGTLVDLDPARAAEALVVLDEVEATATDLLARVAVTTTDGAAAWAYHCDAPADRRWRASPLGSRRRALSAVRPRRQARKSVISADRRLRLLELRDVAGSVDDLEAGPGDQITEVLAVGRVDESVLGAPHQQRRRRRR